jgi:shikimate dehydrogenase
MPFKEAVIPLLDAIEPSAAVIESVNTIVNDDGRLTGYNTDFIAVRDLIAASDADRPNPLSCVAAGHGQGGGGGPARSGFCARHDCCAQ